jgi:K+-sensing histidine kinase KdpD
MVGGRPVVRPAAPCYHENVWRERLSRDQLALAAGLLGPLAAAAILLPFRTHFPNTDAALVMLLVVVAVAANGNRLAGYLAALSTAVWFDFFLTRPYERFTINRQTDIETELLVEHGGLLQGRFLLLPRPGTRPTREQVQVAIALADQVGAALTPASR